MHTTHNTQHTTHMANDFLTKWIGFWVFLFSVSVLSLPGHGGQPAIVLLFTMLYVAIAKRNNRQYFSLNKEERFFIYLVLFWFGWQLFGVFYQPIGYEFENTRAQLRVLDDMSRWLLLLPIFFLFRRYFVDWKVLAIGLSMGVLITVSVAHYEVYFLNRIRAEGMSNHVIPFAELMVVSDLLLWMFMIHAWSKGQKILSYFLLFVSVVAFYGSLLSVTRGAWLAYIFMILIWFVYIIKNSLTDKKHLLSKPILLRLLLAFIVFFTVSQTEQYQTLKSRTQQTVSDLSVGNYQGASSSRLSIFKDTINHIEKQPLGIGTHNFKKIDPDGYLFNAHNQLLNVWVENGIQGVISLLLLVGYSVRFFWKNLNHTNGSVSIYASCGLMLIVSYIIFSQSQVVFDHHQTLMFFVFYLYFFFAQIQFLKRED
ncbi:MAG TPA: O-antigen ligase domain-containing protein [Candidatus Thioglobus autotrophicus]|nr:O-antigen ligase domain-containing protein [Candidatus Thioglobus autotrophicus]